MNKKFLKIAAPALALGLVLSAQGGALAASPNASVKAKTEVKVKQVPGQIKGATVEKRLTPVENRVISVNAELSTIVTELNAKTSLSIEEFSSYQDQLTSLSNRLQASTNQLSAVSKKFGTESSAVVEANTTISASLAAISAAHTLLGSIEVSPVVIEPEPESPTETP